MSAQAMAFVVPQLKPLSMWTSAKHDYTHTYTHRHTQVEEVFGDDTRQHCRR